MGNVFNDIYFGNHLALGTGVPRRGVHINRDGDQLRLSSTGHTRYCDILSDNDGVRITYGDSGAVAINIDHDTGLVTFPQGASFGGMYFETLTTDGIDNDLALTFTPAGGTYNNILVIEGGSIQPPDGSSYTLSGSTLTLGGTTRPSGVIVIVGYSVSGAGMCAEAFTSPGSGSQNFSLSNTPLGGASANVMVYVNGSIQPPGSGCYSLSGDTLTVNDLSVGDSVIAVYAYNI